jgi:hypothetical protein
MMTVNKREHNEYGLDANNCKQIYTTLCNTVGYQATSETSFVFHNISFMQNLYTLASYRYCC